MTQTAAQYETILVDRDGPVAIVTLNRPNVLNALNLLMLSELRAAFAALDADAEVRAVILTGAGPKAFAAGADISELNALPNAVAGARQARVGQDLTLAIERLQKPVIAAINGFALGGGCELALSADIRIASANAKFGQPEVNLGLIPGYGGTQRTARLLGRGLASYLCLSGELIGAEDALRAGLVEKVLPPEGLLDEAKRIAHVIAGKAPLAITAVKRTINDGISLGIAEGLALEALAFGTLVDTEDFTEGTKAFLEKRKPNFIGN